MPDASALAARFEAERPRLRQLAYRMLGSLDEAEDAVQDAWLRLGRVPSDEIGNLGGWLTTVVSRLCLDVLRARRTRADAHSSGAADAPPGTAASRDPEAEAVLAESVGLAMLVVLDRLSPAERVAFVLHDLFAMPFEDVAAIVEREVAATRQLASRARRRVRGDEAPPARDRVRQRELVEAYLAAARDGDLATLLGVLAPGAVFRVDAATTGDHVVELRGAENVARGAVGFAARAAASRALLVGDAVGIAIAPAGRLFALVRVRFEDDRIVEMDMVADPVATSALELTVLDA